MSGEFGRHAIKQLRDLQQARALAYAEGAVLGAVAVAPVPGVAPAATGRTRASIEATNRRPTTYDPGPEGPYGKPNKADAVFHVSRRKAGDSVVLSAGVDYLPDVVALGYDIVAIGHDKGLAKVLKVKARRRSRA